jgi:type IV secretory pathway TraG/TraD family ATPase VirD4
MSNIPSLPAVIKLDVPLIGTNDRREMPLGTAAWYQSDGGRIIRPFQSGDFFLGRAPSGEAVGFNDNRHVLIGCGTRGGKGISIIIPNLVTWPGSTVVIDPKGENAMVTARRRANGSHFCTGIGQKVRILDPFNIVSTRFDFFKDLKASFNPMDALDPRREESVDEAARIADALIVAESSNDPFWEESARGLLKALILHVASWANYAAHERNLITVRRLLVAGDVEMAKLAALKVNKNEYAPTPFGALFSTMKRNPAFGGVVANAGQQYASQEENASRVLASIVQVACTNTDFIDSPGMQRCLAKSDFALSELKTDTGGTNLFICLPQRYMETHFRWLRMMVTLTITEMERVRHQPKSGHPVLMVLDEFPALRRMKAIENAAAQIAGFGVRMIFAVQTLAQLKDIYRDNWETLLANCGVKSFFCNDDHFTREYVSKLIGECEVIRTTANESRSAGWSASRSTGMTTGTSVTTTSGISAGSSSGGQNGSVNHGMSAGHSVSSSSSSSLTTSEGRSGSQSHGLSETIQRRALVTPDEIGRLFGDRDRPASLVLVSGCQPIALARTYYFKERTLIGYFDAHADHPQPMTLRQMQTMQDQKEKAADAERVRIALMRQHAEVAAQKHWRQQRAWDLWAHEQFRRTSALWDILEIAEQEWVIEAEKRRGLFERLTRNLWKRYKAFTNGEDAAVPRRVLRPRPPVRRLRPPPPRRIR